MTRRRTPSPWHPIAAVTILLFFAAAPLVAGGLRVDAPMKKASASLPIPECGWAATLVCTEASDGSRECWWDKTWHCGYALAWPSTAVRRPFAEELIRERYP